MAGFKTVKFKINSLELLTYPSLYDLEEISDQQSEVIRTYSQNAVVTGTTEVDKQLSANITLDKLTESDADLLTIIYKESERKRTTPPYTGFEVSLYDLWHPYIEYAATPTKTIASGTYTTLSGGYIRYFVVRKGLIFPKITPAGRQGCNISIYKAVVNFKETKS